MVGLMAPAASAKHAKIAKDLDTSKGGTVDVIVQFKASPTKKHHDKVGGKGGKLKAELGAAKAGLYTVAASALEDLANDPDVVHVSADREVSSTLDNAVLTVGAGIAKSYGWDGTGIGVAVLDSGVRQHNQMSLSDNVVYKESFVKSDSDPADDHGHGNHVAGIITADGSGGFHGIAPKAKLINLRVLDKNGKGTDSAVIAAIQRAIQLKNTYNIRVMNLSIGRPVVGSYTTDPLCQAVEAAWKAGIVVVVSAGNEGRNNSKGTYGYGTISAPGNDPYVITVGAMKPVATPSRADDHVASYSAKGPTLLDHVVKPDIVAPGNRIVSLRAWEGAMWNSYTGNRVGTEKYLLSGTSMAAPMVSGAVALMLQKTPSLTPDQVKARLMRSATKGFPVSSSTTVTG